MYPKHPKYVSANLLHATPITTHVREIEKNNISLSFNLDFSKFINTGGVSKVKGRSSLNNKRSDEDVGSSWQVP